MEFDKQKYDAHVETNVKPILEKHELISHKAKYIVNKMLSAIHTDLDNYIGDRKKAIKEEIFGELLKFFGKFDFQKGQTLPFQYLHNSMIIPEYTGYASEDRITGVFNNAKIDVAEIALAKQREDKGILSFKGLVIVIDVCNTDLTLRGPFKGNTVLIADHKKHLDYIKDKFKDYTRLEPPVKELEDRFEMYTTDVDEANKMVCERLLRSLTGLSDYIHSLTEQKTHHDDKLEIMYNQLKQDIQTAKDNKQLDEEQKGLWWEELIDEVKEIKDAKLHKVYKEDPRYGVSDMESLNNDVACSFYDDKVLLTIPHINDLFEPNPINEVPIIGEDIELIYHLMKTIHEITNIIIENKSSN